MSTADLREIGSIDLLDLDIISKFYGRDFLPYPFGFAQPFRFSWHDEYVKYARSVPDRFNNGDLAIFEECAGSYANADIRVECHVQYIPADTPSVRVVAFRRDQAGFLAKQRPDEDIIDVYQLSPYLLGPAVADSVALDKPGRQSAIVIPEYPPVAGNAAPYLGPTAAYSVALDKPGRQSAIVTPEHPPVADNADAPEDFTIHHTIEGAPSTTEVARAEVTAYGTVQTHWRPTRHWGIDPGKNVAVWVRIKDDGDYLYQPGFGDAKPMSRPILAEQIDRLISEDVKALRQFRNG